MTTRAFMVSADKYDMPRLLHDWRWLVPEAYTPLYLTVMGDWVFGAPDGSLWRLSALEGDFFQIAANADDYNRLIKSDDWLNETFAAEWQPIAASHGLEPSDNECLGWKLPPILGGKFEPANLQIFEMLVYQSVMGQLHRHLQQRIASQQSRPASRDNGNL